MEWCPDDPVPTDQETYHGAVSTKTRNMAMLEQLRSGNDIRQELRGHRSKVNTPRAGDGRTLQRKPIPSPLQLSETPNMPAVGIPVENLRDLASPHTIRNGNGTQPQQSPRSPRSNYSHDEDSPKLPRARLDELLASQSLVTDEDIPRATNGAFLRGTKVSSPKTQTYGQLRNVSAPVIHSQSAMTSPPLFAHTSSASTVSSSTIRADPHRSAPRTSSIDSAISTVSSATTHSQESILATPAEIQHLIELAGSAEALIQRLLKDKQHMATRNEQLWKVLDNQRQFVLGVTKDLDQAKSNLEQTKKSLDQALKDKERYGKRLKEHLEQTSLGFHQGPVGSARAISASPPRARPPDERSAHNKKSQGPAPYSTLDSAPALEVNSDIAGNLKSNRLPLSHIKPVVSESSRDRNPPKSIQSTDTTTSMESSLSDANSSASGNIVQNMLPIETTALGHPQPSFTDSPTQISHKATVVSPRSFTAKRSLPLVQGSKHNPTLALTESTPPADGIEKTFSPARKRPPAPLDLRPSQKPSRHLHQYGPDDHSESEYEDILEVDGIPAFKRGRKKTREEDDKERVTALLAEQANRSGSKKDKLSKAPPESVALSQHKSTNKNNEHKPQMPNSVRAVSPQENLSAPSNLLSPPLSLAGMLNQSETYESASDRNVISVPLMSPGLPSSPRPMDRPMNSPLPRLPRDGVVSNTLPPTPSLRNGMPSLPLSPRAPRQPIPLPPYTPTASASSMSSWMGNSQQEKSLQINNAYPKKAPCDSESNPTMESAKPAKHAVEPSNTQAMNRGYPSDPSSSILLPPQALNSIFVKVISSRLKPSRQSWTTRGLEEEPVLKLGVVARSTREEMWQVEKALTSLPPLDHQLKQLCAISAKLPDRSLFNGHAPVKIDARKVALESWFETILNTSLSEKAAIVMCQYLSTQVIEATTEDVMGDAQLGSPVIRRIDGKPMKEGFLSKRGKNFGGWKARYFVLDDPTLRYYESPGGPLLGTIKLQNAQIGTQSSHHTSQSPSRAHDDNDGQYRHAFVILETKRSNSSSLVRHLLCAEDDIERDQWVEMLLAYINPELSELDRSRPSIRSIDSGSSKLSSVPSVQMSGRRDGNANDDPESVTGDALRGMSYENTVAAQPPIVSILPDRRPSDTPSPGSPDSMFPSQIHTSQGSKQISGPSNATKIQDAGAWGNKSMAVPNPNIKEHKRSRIWGFRDKPTELASVSSNDSTPSLLQSSNERRTNTIAAFGAPLVEAVRYCSPSGIDVCLPAVVYRCLEYLEAKDASSEEGIFRLSGSSVVIKGLRERFNIEGDFDILSDPQYYDVHAIASLLKMYLRELPSSVLTRELHIAFMKVLGKISVNETMLRRALTCRKADFHDDDMKIAAFNSLVHRLPLENWTLLRALSAFLIGVVNKSDVNKMSIRNVGIVFSPTLNIPAPVIAMFLKQFDSIFDREPEVGSHIEVSVTEPSTTEDVRSPRQQLFSNISAPYDQDALGSMAPTYEQILYDSHMAQGEDAQSTGFISLKPSYESTSHASRKPNQVQPSSVTMPGPEYGNTNRTLAPNSMESAKARRRESSMLLMNSNTN